MRIVFINRYYWPDLSATSQFLTDLAEYLAAQEHDVVVATSRQRLDVPDGALSERESHRGVAIHRLASTRFGRGSIAGRAVDYLSFYVSTIGFVLRHVRMGDTVIAKTDPPMLGAVLLSFVRIKRARIINWLQDLYPEVAIRLGVLRQDSLFVRILAALRDWSVRRARANVVIGSRMREYLQRRTGSATLTVIPNWSPPLEHSPVPSPDNPFRLEHGLKGRVVFCYSGNLGRAHRFESLLAAGQQLRTRGDIHFLIIGGGAQYADVREGAARRGLLKRWTFLPYQSRTDLSKTLGAADVHLVSLDPELEGLIVPSKIYGVLEAGRPCIFIGARDGEIADILDRHGCGIVVDPSDSAGLERAVLKLAANPELRRRMGESARKAASQEYAFANSAKTWQAVLRADAVD